MPRRSFGRRRSAPRRKLVWARSSVVGTVSAAIAPALAVPARNDGLLEFEQSLGASTVGVTVVRTRGFFKLSNAAQAVDTVINVRFTAYVGDNNDVTRAPNANDNAFDQLSQNRDFFLFEPFLTEDDDEQLRAAGTPTYSRMIDVKSSRKIEELNQTIIFDVSAEGANNVAIENVGFIYDLSMLLMLP